MSEDQPSEPAYEYVAYIDESGDPGLDRIKKSRSSRGSSEWLVVAAAVVSRRHEQDVPEWVRAMVRRLKNHQRKGIHFSDLNPAKRLMVCQQLATCECRLFVVASNKKNMRGYDNPFAARISTDVNWFYCWLTRLLIERVSYWVDDHSRRVFGAPKRVKLEYSERGGLSYSQLNAYFEVLKIKRGDLYLPMGNIRWDVVSQRLVEIYPHQERAGLQLADIAAGAFFKACDVYDTGACDPSFAMALGPRIARDPDKSWGRVCGFGVKLMPSWKKAKLLPEQEAIFRHFGYPPFEYRDEWWDPASSVPEAD